MLVKYLALNIIVPNILEWKFWVLETSLKMAVFNFQQQTHIGGRKMMGNLKKLFFSALTVFLFSTINMPDISAEVMTSKEDVSAKEEVTPEVTKLEELVVTAERRTVDVQKMPVSVVALSEDTLKESGVLSMGDLQAIVPSFSYINHGNGSFLNIRGVGLNEAQPNQTLGVAVHLDGAYIAREFTLDDAFFDLERIEVLRGPQGTYVGQNATGGAIYAVTKAPNMNKSEGYAGITYGDYSNKVMEGALSVPVSDTWAFRIALQTETRDSFTKNLGKFGSATMPKETNQPGMVSRYLGRFQLLYKPSDKFDLRLIYQNSSRETDYLALHSNTAASWANPWTATYDTEQQGRDKYDRYTGIANWKATDDIQVKFVASYQKMDHKLLADDDSTSPYVSPGTAQAVRGIQMHDESTTAEVNVLSTSDSKFQWIAGATMLNYKQPFTYQSVNYTTIPDYNTGLIINFTAKRQNYAGFGEVSYKFTPTLELKVGARENKDKTELAKGSYLQFGGPNSPAIMQVSNHADFSEVSGRVLLNWQPTENNFFYLSIARGYKPGGWEPFGYVYKSEIVLNKEIGWKASFFNHNLLTTLDVFHMNYDGFQASFATDPNNPASSHTNNVNGTTIQGLDLQLQALIDYFEFGLNGSYLKTKFGSQSIVEPANIAGPGNPAVPTAMNLEGNELDWAPKLSGSVYAKYTFELGSGATLVPRIGWRYQGAQWTGLFHAPQSRLPSYSLGDFRLRYNPNDNWYIEGYVLNFTDKLYAINIGGNYPGMVEFGAPRQVGITLQYRF